MGGGLPRPLSEEHVLVGDEALHHQSLVSDVVERRHGVQVRRPHQRRPEHDAQVLAGHQVVLLVLGHSGEGEPKKKQGVKTEALFFGKTLQSRLSVDADLLR